MGNKSNAETAPNAESFRETGTMRGTIGGMSAAIGYDVRDLVIDGYSWRQIHEVVAGHMTLQELFAQKPENKPVDTRRIFKRIVRPKDEAEK